MKAFRLDFLRRMGLLLIFALPLTAEAQQDSCSLVLRQRLDSVMAVESEVLERTQCGLLIYDLTADSVLYAHGQRQCLRPASCQKVVTAVTALALLGTDYNYSTTLSLRGEVKDSTLSGDLYIRAGVDPLFSRDDLRAFVQGLQSRGIYHITGDIFVDVSIRDTVKLGWGWCWDDDFKSYAALMYGGRDTFMSNFQRALRDAGITVDGVQRRARVPEEAEEVVRRTHTIDQILMRMMKESDNQYAESLFAQIAARSGKAYAGHKEGEAQVKRFIERLHLTPSHYLIADGSGLSLYNYATPQLLVAMLRYAYQHGDVYEHLLPSLPIAGRDGTLRKRMRGTPAEGNVCAKTGSVTGVSTLAGYCTAPNGHRLAFAFMNQGLRYAATGRAMQDRLCIALTTPVAQSVVEAPQQEEEETAEPAPESPETTSEE